MTDAPFRLSKTRFARGMTLAEMLIALAITAMIGTAALSMLSASVNATDATANTRSALTTRQVISSRIHSYIRHASQVTCATDTTIVFWLGDKNSDDVMNLSEMRIVTFESGTNELVSYVFAEDASDGEYALPDNVATVPDQSALNTYYDRVPLASDLTSCSFTLGSSDTRSARFIQIDLVFTDDAEIGSLSTVIAFRGDLTDLD